MKRRKGTPLVSPYEARDWQTALTRQGLGFIAWGQATSTIILYAFAIAAGALMAAAAGMTPALAPMGPLGILLIALGAIGMAYALWNLRRTYTAWRDAKAWPAAVGMNAADILELAGWIASDGRFAADARDRETIVRIGMFLDLHAHELEDADTETTRTLTRMLAKLCAQVGPARPLVDTYLTFMACGENHPCNATDIDATYREAMRQVSTGTDPYAQAVTIPINGGRAIVTTIMRSNAREKTA